ncbi:MAG: peptide chain release factor 2 [Bdellovibrionales bacterium CG10_big_fil_rev_8_21_14_0_10_45_34]|nr:MAG: peptide chain release factor 2 [Bdellovibrionales bacterium CG10_big_fil_rev_8_21_14_0_10_45_34]
MSLATELGELNGRVANLQEELSKLRGIFDVERRKARLEEVGNSLKNPAVWEKPAELQKFNKEKVLLEKSLETWSSFESGVSDALVLLGFAKEDDDENSFEELKQLVKRLEKQSEDLELEKMLRGETDANSAYLSINSGAGGTEACDWADMLFRMYTRYAQNSGFKVEILDISHGEEAGIKSATIQIQGPFAYGFLKAENGVHRLVRISPFDSNARRHTSFASVFAWPEIDDEIEIEIRTEDLRIDTYRSSGAGGQHVNKTDSAVRMTHIPTGIVVQCQNQRSQHANRDKAMKMMKAALYEREVEERNKLKDEVESTKKANEWGSQIRSYVMQPYQLVKDHRTGYETSQVQDVMNGDLDAFIKSYLRSSTAGI